MPDVDGAGALALQARLVEEDQELFGGAGATDDVDALGSERPAVDLDVGAVFIGQVSQGDLLGVVDQRLAEAAAGEGGRAGWAEGGGAGRAGRMVTPTPIRARCSERIWTRAICSRSP